MSPEVIAALVGLVGIIVGAIPTYLFMRRKNLAEIEKVKAETDKTRAEAKKIELETELLASDTEMRLTKEEKALAEKTAQEKCLEETFHSISTLDNYEKAILREFVIQGRNAIQVPEEDVAVASLLQKGIIYTIADGKQVLGIGWVYPVSLSPSAEAITRGSGFQVIGFPPGKPSPDQAKWIQSSRPGFVLDIERSNW